MLHKGWPTVIISPTMSTKQIPIGTHNLTINVPVADAIAVTRAAGQHGQSMGAYVRSAIIASQRAGHILIDAAAKDASAFAALQWISERISAIVADGAVDAGELTELRDTIAHRLTLAADNVAASARADLLAASMHGEETPDKLLPFAKGEEAAS